MAEQMSELDKLKEKVTQLENDVKFAASTKEQCDFKIHRDPKSWEGESYAGGSILQAADSLSYLGKLANQLDYQARMDEASGDETKKKYVKYKRMDAARCRRLINIKLSTPKGESVGKDEIPF